MRDHIEFFSPEYLRDFLAVAKIDIVHCDIFRDRGNIRALDLRIVKIVEIIEDRDVMSGS